MRRKSTSPVQHAIPPTRLRLPSTGRWETLRDHLVERLPKLPADCIDRMLAMTDPKYVSMIYDTGHLTFSGEDPIEILKKHHDRIKHVHLKNVRKAAMEKCYAEHKSFLRSIPEGVFTVPGDPEGCVDFETVFKLLGEYNYEGWLVVEAEQDPAVANPLDYANMARKYVKEQIGF